MMKTFLVTRILILSFLPGFVSCQGPRMVETQLYFGLSRPDGTMISAAEWDRFKTERISAVFRKGSTTISVTGNWYDPVARKLITEPSYLVSHVYKKSAALSRQIDSLRYWYKTQFNQQSVLRVDKKVSVSF
jgi:hypothetical protein